MRILTRGDVLELLTLRDCIVAVEDAFRLHAEGRTLGPGVLAVAAKFLARPDARSATIVGCGVQGEIQLGAIAAVLPLQRAWVLDTDHARAEGLAARAQANLGIRVEAGKDLRSALRGSDVCVT